MQLPSDFLLCVATTHVVHLVASSQTVQLSVHFVQALLAKWNPAKQATHLSSASIPVLSGLVPAGSHLQLAPHLRHVLEAPTT